jgi:hypothetical protein
MAADAVPPLEGKPVLLPPGRVAVRLDERYRAAYRRLYSEYRTFIDGLPVLRERDFDGRRVLLTHRQLEKLNLAFASLSTTPRPLTGSPFERQEQAKARLFKRVQYLS